MALVRSARRTPRFRIADLYLSFALGTTVNMVGQVSGWRSGSVFDGEHDVDMFVDAPGMQHFLTGVGLATYAAQDGDSGGPVFHLISGDDVKLRGIHQGSILDNGTTYRVLSPLQNVHGDILNSTGVSPISDIEWRWGF